MNCIVCGAKLHGKQQIYCSKACRSRAMYAKRRTPGREYCKYCGAKLDSKSAKRVFCGDRCRQNYYYRERHMESRAEAQQETTEPREITPTTVYLVHKYAAEGMPAGYSPERFFPTAHTVPEWSYAHLPSTASPRRRDKYGHWFKSTLP